MKTKLLLQLIDLLSKVLTELQEIKAKLTPVIIPTLAKPDPFPQWGDTPVVPQWDYEINPPGKLTTSQTYTTDKTKK